MFSRDIKNPISTHVLARGTTSDIAKIMQAAHFNPRPREGNDYWTISLDGEKRDFNPRPREGNDYWTISLDGEKRDFNPRPREGNDSCSFA